MTFSILLVPYPDVHKKTAPKGSQMAVYLRPIPFKKSIRKVFLPEEGNFVIAHEGIMEVECNRIGFSSGFEDISAAAYRYMDDIVCGNGFFFAGEISKGEV